MPVSPGRGIRPRARRFVLVGAVATAVDLVGAVGLTASGISRFPADVVALVVASSVSFVLHRRVTLRGDNLDRWIRKPVVFAVVATAAAIVDLVVYVSLDGLSALSAKLLAITAAAVIRAGAHRAILFRAVRHDQGVASSRSPAPGSVRLSVVVPAYEEEARIASTVARIRTELVTLDEAGDLEIVVVDDGSADGTAAAARRAGADVVIVQPKNRGKGAAVRAGVAVSSGSVVAFTDADLAYPPHQLMGLVEAIEAGWDAVIGDRYHPDTVTVTETSWLRSLGSRGVNMATNILLLGNYRDTQCGCKAFRSDVARIVTGAGVIDGFAFDIEVLHLVERYGMSLREVPVEVVNSEGSTVSALRDGYRVGRDIMRIRHRSRRGGYPALAPGALPPPGSADTAVSGRDDAS